MASQSWSGALSGASQPVDISYFGAYGYLPPGVALLLAAFPGVLFAVIARSGAVCGNRTRRAEITGSGPKRGADSHDGVGGRIRPARQLYASQGQATKPSGHATTIRVVGKRRLQRSGTSDAEGSAMRCYAQKLSLLVTLLAAGMLVAGCGGAISSSIGSGSLPSRTTTASARPGVTVTVTSAPTAPATGSAAPAASSGTSLTWLWVLLGVLVLAGLIAVIARSSRRRSAAAGQLAVQARRCVRQGLGPA
jgi:hypothetical protein